MSSLSRATRLELLDRCSDASSSNNPKAKRNLMLLLAFLFKGTRGTNLFYDRLLSYDSSVVADTFEGYEITLGDI